jgi:hypothetical protein
MMRTLASKRFGGNINFVIADIRREMEVVPFIPFRICMADGREYAVPTVDHVYLPPPGGRVIVAHDDGTTSVLPALLISGILRQSAPVNPSPPAPHPPA